MRCNRAPVMRLAHCGAALQGQKIPCQRWPPRPGARGPAELQRACRRGSVLHAQAPELPPAAGAPKQAPPRYHMRVPKHL